MIRTLIGLVIAAVLIACTPGGGGSAPAPSAAPPAAPASGAPASPAGSSKGDY